MSQYQSDEDVSPQPRLPVLYGLNGVWCFSRNRGHRGRAVVPTGHLLHYLLAGTYTAMVGSERFSAAAGDVVTYRGGESVLTDVVADEVEFISINFSAYSALPIKPWRRVFSRVQRAEHHCRSMLRLWRSNLTPVDDYHLFSQLYALLALLCTDEKQRPAVGPAEIWREVEQAIHVEGNYRIGISELAEKTAVSRSTLQRICRQVTGLSPAARLRRLRLDEARALLRFSGLRISEIAYQLGFSRVQEFSREFRAMTGRSPREYRQGTVDEAQIKG